MQVTERILGLILLKIGQDLIATLVQDMKLLVVVKDDFAGRDEPKVQAYFGIFENLNSDARKKIICFICQ